MKHLVLMFHIFMITFAMYLVRPVESFISALLESTKAFCIAFKNQFSYKMWWRSNIKPIDLYKMSINEWKAK